MVEVEFVLSVQRNVEMEKLRVVLGRIDLAFRKAGFATETTTAATRVTSRWNNAVRHITSTIKL